MQDEDEYQALAYKEVKRWGYAVEAVDEIEPFSALLARTTVDQQLEEAAASLTDSEPIAFGVFHVYDSDDEHYSNEGGASRAT